MNALVRELLSLVVPPLCCACREPELSGSAVCCECRARLVRLPPPWCARCGAPTVLECADCHECRGRALGFRRAWAPFAYAGVARLLVGGLKSRGAVSLGRFMAGEIAARAPDGLLAGTVVPVPAHRRRHRRHGFNQAESIARALARDASLPLANLLMRTAAGPQVGLERRDRLANVRDSVRLRRRRAAPARVLLVDDVYTTGATLDASARALREAGAHDVTAVSFARAIRSPRIA